MGAFFCDKVGLSPGTKLSYYFVDNLSLRAKRSNLLQVSITAVTGLPAVIPFGESAKI